MRRLVAILNPKSDRGRTAALAASLRAALSNRFEVVLRETTRGGDGVTLAKAAAGERCDAVIAVGGDGTVHEVANGLMAVAAELRPAMGIIPAGSGNDVAFALRIGNDLRRCVAMIERSETRAVDVARVECASGRKCFAINNVGTLLEGAINLASHHYSWPRGSGLYVRAVLRTLMRSIPVASLRLNVDGVELNRSAIMLSIANGPRSGGKFVLMPEADPCDGQLNFVVAAPVGRWRLLWKASRAMQGAQLSDSWIERSAFQRLGICSSIPLVTHVDGEPWLRPEDDCRELSVQLEPGALQVICDPGP